MAKPKTDKLFKANVDGLLYYPLAGKMIVRTASGFTKESRMTNPKYENCSKSASEFGSVSSICKKVRLALSEVLPKQNNRQMVYSLTKKMREVLEYDTTNARGERKLANALTTEDGRQHLKDYEFNPNTTIKLAYTFQDKSLTVNTENNEFPKGINYIGFRLHQLAFDFTNGESTLVSGEWVINSENLVLDVPDLGDLSGVRFVILEADFYNIDNKILHENGAKSVIVIAIE